MALGLIAHGARADIVIWDIDPAQSFVRLTIPDQSVSIDGTSATIRLRDNGSTSNWTDAGGRRAFVDGTAKGDFVKDTGRMQFLSGMHNIFALEQANVRPDPAQFTGGPDANNPDGTYVGTAAAGAAYGARVRATVSILTVDVAYLAMRNVLFDISSGVIALGGGGTTIPGNTSNFGIASSSVDVDGLPVTGFGQPIPDIRDEPLNDITGLNTAAGSIADLGGNNLRLTYNINVPIMIDIEGVVLNGSADGQIVAFAVVPEPATFTLAGLGAIGLAAWRMRRRLAPARTG
jgi:hypothetical protein